MKSFTLKEAEDNALREAGSLMQTSVNTDAFLAASESGSTPETFQPLDFIS